jgi:hypothetical protein
VQTSSELLDVSANGHGARRAVESADVVIGVPTYNDVERIEPTLRAAQAACAELPGDAVYAIVLADGGSTDGTVERASSVADSVTPFVHIPYPLDAVDKLSGPYRGVPALGNAVRAVFDAARRLGAKACAIVDADVEQFAPGWLEALVHPIVALEYDFVTPYYAPRKHAGAINNGLVYPLVRALYGKRVRYPIGGDFAASARLIDRYATDAAWATDAVRSTADLWLTTRALSEGARVGQAMLGVKRLGWRDPGADASGALSKVLSALFLGAEQWRAVWQRVRGSEPTPLFGAGDAIDPASLTVDVRRHADAFKLAAKHLQEVWGLVLPPRTILDLRKLATQPPPTFRLPDALWARIVYDFAIAFHQRTLNREHVLAAFAPLFSAWVASFTCETQDASVAESDERLEQLCLQFEGEKPYLISRWRWPDRFSP